MKIFGVYTTNDHEEQSENKYVIYADTIKIARETVACVIDDYDKVIIEEIMLNELDSGAKFEVYSREAGLEWKSLGSLIETEEYGYLNEESRKAYKSPIYIKAIRTDVEYFWVGTISEGKLTGIVYGYEGGGEYSYKYIFKGSYIPEYKLDGEAITDGDTVVDLFKVLVGVDLFDRMESYIDAIFSKDDLGNLVAKKETVALFNEGVYTNFSNESNFSNPRFNIDQTNSIPIEVISVERCIDEGENILLSTDVDYEILSYYEFGMFLEDEDYAFRASWIEECEGNDNADNLIFTDTFSEDLRNAIIEYCLATENVEITYQKMCLIYDKEKEERIDED